MPGGYWLFRVLLALLVASDHESIDYTTTSINSSINNSPNSINNSTNSSNNSINNSDNDTINGIWSSVNQRDNVRLAKTIYGNVKGAHTATPYGDIIQFRGIPFAKPPIGDLRFQPPFSPDPWTGDRDAFSFGNVCLQGPYYQRMYGSEDCLYLNVYIPANDAVKSGDPPLSVMVWIHGGGFKSEAGSVWDTSGLASKGVIVVTFNYRLDVIPGNYGMLDQVMALKWVQQNIAFFGGDPAKVTIFGASAGASSVSLLLLSPLTKGLFHRAIMESGSSLGIIAITHPTTHPRPLFVAKLIGNRVGCTDEDSTVFLDCLRKVDYLALFEASQQIQIQCNNLVMKPRVEKTFGFLPDLPIKLLAAGDIKKVDTMHGFTSDEIAYIIGNSKYDKMTVTDFQKVILGTLEVGLVGLLKSVAIPDKDKYVQMAMNIYNITDYSDPVFIRDQAIQAGTNLEIVSPIINELRLLCCSRQNDADTPSVTSHAHFLYRFGYRPSYSEHPPWVKISHLQDLFLVQGVEAFQEVLGIVSESDKAMSNTVRTLWTNFAKTGNPNTNSSSNSTQPEFWKPFTEADNYLLELDSKLSIGTFDQDEVTDFYMLLLNKISTEQDLQ